MSKPIMKIVCTGEKPSYANEYAAGLDIRSNTDVIIRAGEAADVETRLAVEIPRGHFGMIVPRSGLGFKYQITLINDVGVIDEDYRGNIGLRLINEGKNDYHIGKGDKVAQMVIIPYKQVSITYVDKLNETNRGTGGFGHTGK